MASPNPPQHPLSTSERANVIRQQQELFSHGAVSRELLDCLPHPLLIINDRWQVVYANQAVLSLSGMHAGFRQGESFHCLHASKMKQSPGGAESCRVCGVARGVVLALKGKKTVNDCRLSCELVGESASLDLRVWATPLVSAGETYSVLLLTDIGDEKRRALMENVCFHDLLNTLTSIRGFLDVLKHSDVDERPEICQLLEQTTQNAIEEIISLRLLAKAENSELQIVWDDLQTQQFMQRTVKALSHHPSAAGKALSLDPESADLMLRSDRSLLRRLVGNMMLNALEATDAGGAVTAGCRQEGGKVTFWVHNDRCIPPNIQSQIFQRSFSTKGTGRGLGTYSIALLSAVLSGEASFHSTPEAGTTFYATFPLHPQPEVPPSVH